MTKKQVRKRRYAKNKQTKKVYQQFRENLFEVPRVNLNDIKEGEAVVISETPTSMMVCGRGVPNA